MRTIASLLIIALLLLNAIQLAVIFSLKKRYKKMQQKFLTYLDSLDRENERLHYGKAPEKARRDYKKLIT